MVEKKVDSLAKNVHGFGYENPLLEEYLTNNSTRWHITGVGLKPMNKSAARSAAASFEQTVKAQRHRAVFFTQLRGAGINEGVARSIAFEGAN